MKETRQRVREGKIQAHYWASASKHTQINHSIIYPKGSAIAQEPKIGREGEQNKSRVSKYVLNFKLTNKNRI